jgi:hypothetical protein
MRACGQLQGLRIVSRNNVFVDITTKHHLIPIKNGPLSVVLPLVADRATYCSSFDPRIYRYSE